EMDPDIMHIIKGGSKDTDMLSHAYIRLEYFGPDRWMLTPDKEWYEDCTDLQSFEAGGYTWNGFSGMTMDAPITVLWTEADNIGYQLNLMTDADKSSFKLEDADVQAILMTLRPSTEADPETEIKIAAAGGTADKPDADKKDAAAADFSWWNKEWYGWWTMKNGTGSYQGPCDAGVCWDTYANIEVYDDNTGYLTLWDTETAKDSPLIRGYLNFEEGSDSRGKLVNDWITFFDAGQWLPQFYATPMDIDAGEWIVDPSNSSVSHFENMIEITGHYEDPDGTGEGFDYYIYLRPWGTDWSDVANGDTSGCLYKDMMPVIYNDWYVPLVNMGESLPDSIADGFAILGQ
ncbi:MAG: hypothetical protein IKL30_05255, partial [Anaerotignum sp.]|nr:hypothetical protein [Anaerotignum sp.]